jgi:DNA (cytosine-5)-methyltransferase 3A
MLIEEPNSHFAKPVLPAGVVGLRVLSLFDGMSCGQQALERIGVNVLEYYASEIDKHAIAVTMHNYPNTKQLGSVIDVDGYKLPKIDLLIGGSPCQSFSFAGKRKGMSTKCETEILTLEHYLELKAEGYEFEGQSYLFWEYMRLLNEVKPKYFLLENVMMGEKWEKILSKAIGVNAIEINSALVSAQNRRRLYWTNIGLEPGGLFGDLVSTIKQPKDKGIMLKDILEMEVDEKYYLSQQRIETMLKSERSVPYVDENTNKYNCLLAGYNKIPTDGQYIVHNTMPRSGNPEKGGTGHLSRVDGKTYCLDTGNTNAVEIVAMRGRGEKGNIEQQLETNGTDKSNSLTTVTKDNLVLTQIGFINNKNSQANRVYDGNAKSVCLQGEAGGGGAKTGMYQIEKRIRRLTPLECERLQTVNDGYTSVASDSQRYRMLGNGWTVDVIAHILSYGEWS